MLCPRIQALRSTTTVGVLVALGVALGGAASPANAAQQIAVDARASTLQSSYPNLGVEANGYFDIGFDAERLIDVER